MFPANVSHLYRSELLDGSATTTTAAKVADRMHHQNNHTQVARPTRENAIAYHPRTHAGEFSPTPSATSGSRRGAPYKSLWDPCLSCVYWNSTARLIKRPRPQWEWFFVLLPACRVGNFVIVSSTGLDRTSCLEHPTRRRPRNRTYWLPVVD